MSVHPGLGQRLRRLRLEKGLSQAELAGGSLTGSAVSLIEAGRRVPSPATLSLLAKRLDCTVAYLRDGVESRERAGGRGLLLLAELALQRDAAVEAAEQFKQALDTGDLDWELVDRARLGGALAVERMGRLPAALETLEALARARADEGRPPGLALAVALSRCYRAAGDGQRGIRVAEAGLARAVELGLGGSGEHVELATTLVATLADQGEIARAADIARGIVAEVGDPGPLHDRAAAHWEASRRAEAQGDIAEANWLRERALGLYAERSDALGWAGLRTAAAWLLLRVEPPDVEAAAHELGAAHRVLDGVGDQTGLACCEIEIARAELLAGRPGAGFETAQRALGRLPGDGLESVYARMILGQCQRARGEAELAAATYGAAAGTLAALRPSRQIAGLWNELGDLLQSAGDAAGAAEAYSQALRAAGLRASLHSVR